MKVGGILGMIGAGINLAITGPIGLFLVITGFSSLGKTTVDDSTGWGQFFFFVGCILLVLSLGHVLALVALAMARAGRNGAGSSPRCWPCRRRSSWWPPSAAPAG